MRTPLHLKDRWSLEGLQRRVSLHADQAEINPNGWRKPRTQRIGARNEPRSWFDNVVRIIRIIKGQEPEPVVGAPRVVEIDPVQAVINKLTNWQRHQWARAGCPGWKKRQPKLIEPFTQLVHP